MAGSSPRALPAPAVGAPLLSWLLDALRPMKRTRVKEMLRHGRILVNGIPITRHDHALRPGDQIAIASPFMDRSLEEAGVTIVMEDESLVIIDKPPGLLSVATAAEKTDTAFARLNAHLSARNLARPFVVHRLDRETSGLLLFARSAALRDRLQASWESVTKVYLAVVEGTPPTAEGIVDNYLIEGRDLRVRATRKRPGAQHAVTHYSVVTRRGKYTLLQVILETGRKHQIRVHLAGIGCPIIGDPVYGTASDPAHRLGLHAHRMAFEHPTAGNKVEVESPLPAALGKVMGL